MSNLMSLPLLHEHFPHHFSYSYVLFISLSDAQINTNVFCIYLRMQVKPSVQIGQIGCTWHRVGGQKLFNLIHKLMNG